MGGEEKRPDVSTPEGMAAYKLAAEEWAVTCESWHDELLDIEAAHSTESKARDPQQQLDSILSSPDPMGAVLEIIEGHRCSRPPGELRKCDPGTKPDRGAVRLATWWRDHVLLLMLTANPLRNANYTHLTPRPENSSAR